MKISREEFLKLDEKDIMFITIPGRMGDEDGTTFYLKKGNEFIKNRISGWMYPSNENIITLEETAKQFPKWYETWNKSDDKNYKGKYKYLYMGFGNALCIDNSIYNEYEPYLNKLINKYLEDKDDESYKYSTIFNV